MCFLQDTMTPQRPKAWSHTGERSGQRSPKGHPRHQWSVERLPGQLKAGHEIRPVGRASGSGCWSVGEDDGGDDDVKGLGSYVTPLLGNGDIGVDDLSATRTQRLAQML